MTGPYTKAKNNSGQQANNIQRLNIQLNLVKMASLKKLSHIRHYNNLRQFFATR